ncbi:MAG: class I tRNA ligase family protein, partial [Eubacteriales bacterium]|nr:class I tRNA ligase family protein [Eubacteriales bacterium]
MLTDEEDVSAALRAAVNGAIKKVGEDYEKMKFNTAIAAMMSLVNEMYAVGRVSRGDLRALLLILSPVAPHICEEMWAQQGFGGRVYAQSWPSYDPEALIADTVELAVQINGKVKARIRVAADAADEEIRRAALEDATVAAALSGRPVRKVIVIRSRLVNIVV